MSAMDQECKKRKKRKTRAERNQIARRAHQEGDKQKKFQVKSKKPADHTQSQNQITYSLRSSKGLSLPCLIPKDFVRSTTGNITQGRLTRPLALFDNAKTSVWATRATLPETEEMKKNVEKDLQRILNMSGLEYKSTSASLNNVDKCDFSKQKSGENQTDRMEVDPPLTSSQPASKNVPAVEKNTSKSSAHSSPAETNIIPTMSLASPVKQEEILDPEPPIEDIADTIIKELKLKFDKLFPNRDVEYENCCDLEKLIKQSCQENELPIVKPKDLVQGDKKITAASKSRMATYSSSVQSYCPPLVAAMDLKQFPNIYSASSTPQMSTPQSSALITSAVHGTRSSATNIPSEQPASDMLITNMEEEEDDEEEKIITIKLDDEEESGPPVESASYDEFIDSAREMKLKLEQNQLNQLHSLYYHSASALDGQDVRKHCCGARGDWQSGLYVPQWKSGGQTIHFSQPKGFPYQDSSMPCSIRHSGKSMSADSVFYAHKVHPGSAHRFQLQAGYSDSHTPDTNIFGRVEDSSCNCKDLPFFVDKSVRHSHERSADQRYGGMSREGQFLAKSRFNFQEALDSACRMSDVRQRNSDCVGQHMCQEPGKSTRYIKCQCLKYRHKYLGNCSGQLSYSMSQPLVELQGHQADLQRQAKDFLDDLEQSILPLEAERSPQSCSTHLFPIGSPNSNRSSAWMPSCIMKDVRHKTASSLV
ncbi:hypothetical protein BgiBS90_018617 [Biomphalaria glabrata]|nr:hypothetical protein BgiBS90_018617 [Biomphalaria glabrata]